MHLAYDEDPSYTLSFLPFHVNTNLTMASKDSHQEGSRRTNLTQWRLTSTNGAHRWTYLSTEDSKRQPQSVAEQYFLGILKVSPSAPSPISPLLELTPQRTLQRLRPQQDIETPRTTALCSMSVPSSQMATGAAPVWDLALCCPG